MVVKPSESFMQGTAILSTGVCWHMAMDVEERCREMMFEELQNGYLKMIEVER
jgi:hypothetical protein